MKKTLISIILLIIVNLNISYSQNTMRIDTLSGHSGDTLTFSLKINNVKSFVAFQTDIQFPAQLTYVNNSAVLTSRANGHSFAANMVNSSLLRVIAYSFVMSPFLGNSGAVMTFKCVSGNVPGNYNLMLQSPIISDSLNANILTNYYNGLYTMLAPRISFNTSAISFGRTLWGTNLDYNFYIYNNGTSTLTVSKLTTDSSNIRFLDSSGFTLAPGGNKLRTVRMYADSRGIKTAILKVYSDDIFDTVHIVTAQGEVYTTNELYLNTVTAKYGYTGTLKIRMKNFDNVNAFQTSITLPASITYVPGSVVLNPARTNDHVITASVLSGNILKIISYSPTNKSYLSNDSTIAQFNFVAKVNPGGYSIPITEGFISDTNGINVCSNVYGGTINVTSPLISLPSGIVFDTISYIDTNRKILVIQNTGNDTLTISGISATESSFANETALPVKIPPSNARNFTIRFTNSIEGLHTGNLSISHNDSLRNPGTVPVRGIIYKPARLKVTSSDFYSRDTSYLPFNIKNTKPFTAFQFDVTLPSQSAFVQNSAVLTSRANGHQVFTSTLGNGDIRVIAYSLSQNRFLGDSGDVVQLKIAINADTGVYPVSVKNVIISDSNNTNISTGFDNGFFRVNPYPPALISPANGSVGNPVNISLLWRRSPFATYYHLQVATDSLFTNKLINDSTYTDSTSSLTNLTPLGYYYWRIRIKNYSGASQFTNFWKFRIIGPPALSPLVYPPKDTVNMPLTITFKWNKAVDQVLFNGNLVNKYWFELSADSLFTSPVRDTTLSDTVKTVSGLVNIAKYYWRIKAKNEIGWGLFTPFSNFTTIVPAPSVPNLIAPINNITGVLSSQVFVWSKPQYASGYCLQLSTDSAFVNIVFSDSTLTDSVKIVNNLLPLTNYWWRVKAVNVGGQSNYSGAWKFRTLGAPFAITLSSPADNSVNQPVDIIFKWFKGIDQTDVMKKGKEVNVKIEPLAVSNYWFELASDIGFNNIISRDSLLSDTTKIITSLNNLTDYYWRVKAKNQTGWSTFSAVWKFTTIVAAPGAPSLVSPANNSIGNPLNMNLVWTKPVYSINYNVLIATDVGFTNIILNDSTLTDSVKVLTNLNPLTIYYWKVRAKNIAGWSGFSGAYNFKTIGVPTQVALSSPVNNSTGLPVNLSFNWFKAIDQTMIFGKTGNTGKIQTDEPLAVSNYWFEYGTDSTFAVVTGRDTTLTDTTKSVIGLSNLTKYFWRVRAKNQIGWAAFSSIWNLTTIIAIPAAPVLISPANGSTNISLTPSLNWTAVSGASSYRIQVSTDSLFATTQYDTTVAAVTTVTIPTGKLSQTTKYFWRVNATNAGGTGPYSIVWNFRTLALQLSLNLKVYLEGFWDGTQQVTDTVSIYLANTTTPFAFADTAKVVLSATGTAANLTFSRAVSGSYYIVVSHRNHLETWSKLPQTFIGGTPLNYDFTTSAAQAFGDNMKQVGSVWVFFGGDANQDGSIDAFDIVAFVPQFGTQGYLSCDFNGDEDVSAADVFIITANYGLTKAVPTLSYNYNPPGKKIINMNEVMKKINTKKLNVKSNGQ